MPVIKDARNAAYNENGTINAEVLLADVFESDGKTPKYLPFTASENDSTDHGRQLFADLKAGKYGEVTPFTVVPVPPPTITPEMLAAAKSAKHAEINMWRDNQEDGRITCIYNGNTYDADKESKYRIDNVIEAGGLPDGVKWTDSNNNDIALSLSDLKALQKIMVVAMAVQGGKIHERQRQMKEEVDKLDDYKAVQNYVVGWGG
ncbi:DUF4376 domain-containing protein [Salmonella enterica subsp. diarizonae]|nr:DUF4376 domain-containing protein [Salmonella enterica subsp. diarizonae]